MLAKIEMPGRVGAGPGTVRVFKVAKYHPDAVEVIVPGSDKPATYALKRVIEFRNDDSKLTQGDWVTDEEGRVGLLWKLWYCPVDGSMGEVHHPTGRWTCSTGKLRRV